MTLNACIELLDDVDECLEDMRETKNVRPTRVKSMLEHMRSTLEYLANDIYDQISPNHPRRPNVNFPYNKPSFVKDFFKKTLKSSPSEQKELFELITSIQDYHTGDDWLVMMCNLTNEVKHRKPIPLDRRDEVTSTDIVVGGFNLFKIDGDGKGVDISIGKIHAGGKVVRGFRYTNGNVSVASSSHSDALNIKITTDNKIRFHGHDYEVIPFIEKCISKLRSYIVTAYKVLNDLA